MAEERKPGEPTSREAISKQTNTFLGSLQDSNYSSVSGISIDVLSQAAGITGLGAPNNLTMVKGALLPMTISMADSNNKRVQFTLLVNPESVNHGKTQTTNAAMTRRGFVTQVWGPNQDLLTGNGKTAAFMTPETGLTNKGQQRSIGFQNFMAFFSAYRNNGYELLDLTDLKGLTRVINVIHGVEISYDGQIFMGHFNNFTIDEVAETPYILNYNFEFVISTLNDVYNEIRGHFIPIGKEISPSQLVDKVGQQ